VETTRFAPSPTGWLHLGHAYAAWYAWKASEGGAFLLRIEDIDADRVRPAYREGIYEDLRWLGLSWHEPVMQQSGRLGRYRHALETLCDLQVAYPCFCSRKEIAAEVAAAGFAPHGDGELIYPGTCRELPLAEQAVRVSRGDPFAWRLDVAKALERTGSPTWTDKRKGIQRVEHRGDPVIARKDLPTSYHLSVTVDDADQGVSLVTRGEDLFGSTSIHRMLQELLGFSVPSYDHHPLVGDEKGNRLSKRDESIALRALRDEGVRPETVLELATSRLLEGA
jgi:glutamyl-Q tRNA(Asp) synthetase